MSIMHRPLFPFILLILHILPLSAQNDSRLKWGIEGISEAQWNATDGRTAWANKLAVALELRTWKGGSISASALATGHLGDAAADDLQDFSNINAESRAFRFVDLGIGQHFADKLFLFAGLREADEDYFNTPAASVFTGSAYGCVPQAGDNFALGVYPDAALGLHVEYAPTASWCLRTSVYNGAASDRLDSQFRFRPRHDGLANIGSITFTPSLRYCLHPDGSEDADALTPTYVVGYLVGWQYDAETSLRRRGATLWASVDQPLFRIGRARLGVFAMGGGRIGQLEDTRGHWAAALILSRIMRHGGTIGVGISRAYYSDAHEHDIEATACLPLLSWLSLQPTLHLIHTTTTVSTTAFVPTLRLNISLGTL